MKKVISTIAALAAMTAMCMNVSAADWSAASYADNDPSTVKIISSDANGITFTTTETGTDICKARITLDKVLANPDDYANIARMEWKVTYNGVTPELVAEVGLSGGTYVTNTNSSGYTIEPDEYDDDGNGVWKQTSYSTMDGLTVETPLEKDGEIVFMDWSFADIGGQGVTVTVSDWKIYDKDGNEIVQLAYGDSNGDADADTPVPDETMGGVPSEGTESVSEGVSNPVTGNRGCEAALAVIAASGAVIAACHKKKD